MFDDLEWIIDFFLSTMATSRLTFLVAVEVKQPHSSHHFARTQFFKVFVDRK